MQRRTFASLLVCLLLFCLTGCVTGTGTATVSGSLLFTADPPPATGELITVEIYSFESVDSRAIFIARSFVVSNGTNSLPFSVAYDKSQIVPKDIYIVQAYIPDGNNGSSWTSDLWNPIITQGRQTEEIELRLKPR